MTDRRSQPSAREARERRETGPPEGGAWWWTGPTTAGRQRMSRRSHHDNDERLHLALSCPRLATHPKVSGRQMSAYIKLARCCDLCGRLSLFDDGSDADVLVCFARIRSFQHIAHLLSAHAETGA